MVKKIPEAVQPDGRRRGGQKAPGSKISYIYVSVKNLAELTSEGETADGTQSTGGWPGTTLRRGSTGSNVEQVQFWLSDLAQFDSSLPAVTVDGSYGAATERAVKVFQQKAKPDSGRCGGTDDLECPVCRLAGSPK